MRFSIFEVNEATHRPAITSKAMLMGQVRAVCGPIDYECNPLRSFAGRANSRPCPYMPGFAVWHGWRLPSFIAKIAPHPPRGPGGFSRSACRIEGSHLLIPPLYRRSPCPARIQARVASGGVANKEGTGDDARLGRAIAVLVTRGLVVKEVVGRDKGDLLAGGQQQRQARGKGVQCMY